MITSTTSATEYGSMWLRAAWQHQAERLEPPSDVVSLAKDWRPVVTAPLAERVPAFTPMGFDYDTVGQFYEVMEKALTTLANSSASPSSFAPTLRSSFPRWRSRCLEPSPCAV